MKISFNILRLSAGLIEDNQMLYANAFILDTNTASTIESNRIDVGQQQAKVPISTDNNNQLARDLANTFTFPCDVVCDVETTVKSGNVSMKIIGFERKKVA